jgi:hypothetical protein
MSIEINFNPNSFPIPGIITQGPHEVDFPSGDPNSINNPDLSQVQGLDQSLWKVVNKSVVPFTDADITKKNLFAGPASQAAEPIPSDNINLLLHEFSILNSPIIVIKGIKFGGNFRWGVSNGTDADFGNATVPIGDSLDLLNSLQAQVQMNIFKNGDLVVSKLRGLGSYDVYLDGIYL